MIVNFSWLLILTTACGNGLASFSTYPECQLEYRVESGSGHILITPQWKMESCRQEEVMVATCQTKLQSIMFSHPTQDQAIPDLTAVGIHPLVQLSTCSQRVVSATSILSIGHTLLTIARQNQSACINTTAGQHHA